MHFLSHTLTASLGLLAAGGAPTDALQPHRGPSFYFGDIDGDSDLDVFVASAGGPDRLLLNAGDGVFTEVSERAGLASSQGSSRAVWSDLDGDGDLDLLTSSPNAPTRLWVNDGAGVFTDLTRESGLASEVPDLAVRVLDFDGDGVADLQRITASGDRLFRGLDKGRFEELDLADLVAATLGSGPPPAMALAPAPQPLSAPGAPGTLAAGSPGVISTTPGGTQALGNPSFICAGSVEDMQNPGTCIPLSTIPTLGMLYPLGLEFNIDPNGRVGIGTTTPAANLDVVGKIQASGQIETTTTLGAPLVVHSTTKVTNLNADMLDGLTSNSFTQLGQSIEGSEVTDGTIDSADLASDSVGSDELAANSVQSLNIFPDTITATDIATGAVLSAEIADSTILDVDINPLAGITGTKIKPSFGTQTVEADGTGLIPAMRGSSINGPTFGYLGVQGTNDYDGILEADWNGQEIGVAGVSLGASTSDNYGVRGLSNYTGVHGQGGVYGVRGEAADPGSTAVYGSNSSDDSQSVGVMGKLTSTTGNGVGVKGEAPFYGTVGSATSSGIGLVGDCSLGLGAYAIGLDGFFSVAQGSNGSAVRGIAESAAKIGIEGEAQATSGFVYGVYGKSQSSSGVGVRGEAYATSGVNWGLQGRTHSSSGWGVISYGASGATGQKNFIQPHPTDPSKELHFFSLEGNESGTYFRGTDRTVAGVCVVEVPEEFRLVSSAAGLSVQLTAVGAPAQLWVEERSLERIIVRADMDVEFDYTVNGVRRGFEEVELEAENHNFVPELRGVPFGTQYPESYRRILVENGILNPDFTPNEATAGALGWALSEPEVREAPEAIRRYEALRDEQAVREPVGHDEDVAD